jgi:hypothetical protein
MRGQVGLPDLGFVRMFKGLLVLLKLHEAPCDDPAC